MAVIEVRKAWTGRGGDERDEATKKAYTAKALVAPVVWRR